MKTIELWPRPVFGPSSRKRFGKPATVVPRWACGLPSQTSASDAPVAAADALGDRQVGDVEAGAEDDRVDLVLGAVGGRRSSAARTSRDAVGDDLDVRLRASAG